jgi:hypothetical protein
VKLKLSLAEGVRRLDERSHGISDSIGLHRRQGTLEVGSTAFLPVNLEPRHCLSVTSDTGSAGVGDSSGQGCRQAGQHSRDSCQTSR